MSWAPRPQSHSPRRRSRNPSPEGVGPRTSGDVRYTPRPVNAPDPSTIALLRLTLTRGLGPILIARLLEAFGAAERILTLSPAELERIRGIGSGKSASIARALRESESLVETEL